MKKIQIFNKYHSQLLSGHEKTLHDDIVGNFRPIVLFFLIVFLYLYLLCATQPNMMFGGEMWAEMATNYYKNANAASYFQKLFSTDSGYIPIPQRIIAMIGNQINLPAKAIPYFYTWSSVIMTSVLVGVFCLPQFSKVVKSDYLRFFTSIAILIVADFETRTFINFTYFAAFFIAVITALALTDKENEIPWWSWFIPIFMISKPAVLASLPAMILVGLVSRSRFRFIVFFSTFLGLIQLIQMYLSSTEGIMPARTREIAVSSKLQASAHYSLGFLGKYVINPLFSFDNSFYIITGILIVCLIIYLIVSKRFFSNSLIYIGLSLLFFNMLLNTFALSDIWNLDLFQLHQPMNRSMMVGYFGCILVVCALINSMKFNESFESSPELIDLFKASILVIWFVSTGWIMLAKERNIEPNFPTIYASQWQNMSKIIDKKKPSLCVPINPWWSGSHFMYSKNCSLLNPPPAWEDDHFVINDNLIFQIKIPSNLLNKTIVSAAILVRPKTENELFLKVTMRFQLIDGSSIKFVGSQNFGPKGGLLMLLGKKTIPTNHILSATLTFNNPVEVASSANAPAVPGVAWMGY